MKPEDFIAQIGPPAKKSMADTQIPASFTIAQAALESAWGSKAPGFNLFGVKADRSWQGAVVNVPTHEFDPHGNRISTTAEFRAYPSWLASIQDHARFLDPKINPRYLSAYQHKDGIGFAQAIAAAGYATDPEYADKLASIIRYHHLQEWDA